MIGRPVEKSEPLSWIADAEQYPRSFREHPANHTAENRKHQRAQNPFKRFSQGWGKQELMETRARMHCNRGARQSSGIWGGKMLAGGKSQGVFGKCKQP